MDQRTFNVVASVIFMLVALLHLLRIYMGWPVVIGSWTVPMWVSWIALVVAGGLSYFGLNLARQAHIKNIWQGWGCMPIKGAVTPLKRLISSRGLRDGARVPHKRVRIDGEGEKKTAYAVATNGRR